MPYQAFSRLSLLTVFTPTGLAWPIISLSNPGILSESEDYLFQNLLLPDSVIMLTLQETFMQALKPNPNIQLGRKTRSVRLTAIIFQQAQFDLTLQLNGLYDRTVFSLNRLIFALKVLRRD